MSTLQETALAGATRAAPVARTRRGRARDWIRQPDVRAALTATVALRLFTSAFAALIVSMLHATFVSVSVQADTQGQAAGLTIVPTSLHGVAQFLTTPWVRWDADVYVKIAEHGYGWYGSTAFMPLYPALVHMGGLGLGGHYILASLILSTVASFFMFLCLYRLVVRITGSVRVSRYTLAVACLLPVAFFFMAPYTESLFLALAFAATLDSLDGRWGRAACYAVIASVTRQQGVLLSLLAVPALWEAVTHARRLHLPTRERVEIAWRQARQPLLLVAAAVGAYAVWIVCLTVIAGAPAPWQVLTSSHGWRQHFEIPGAGVINDIRTIIQDPGHTLAHKMSLPLDVVAAFLGALGLWLSRKRLPAGLFLFLLACWCAALVKLEPTGWTNSAARYLLVLLPVCIVPASWLAKTRPSLRAAYIGFFVLVSCLYLTEWVLWSWVS